MPSILHKKTPTVMVHMGFTTISAHAVFSTLPTKINLLWSKTALSWPLSSRHMPTIHQRFGARGTFRPWRSGPDQACHLPEALVPRPRKNLQSHTQGVPHAASHDYIQSNLLYTAPDVRLWNNDVSLLCNAINLYMPSILYKVHLLWRYIIK